MLELLPASERPRHPGSGLLDSWNRTPTTEKPIRVSGSFELAAPTQGNSGDTITDLDTCCEASGHQATYALGGNEGITGKNAILFDKLSLLDLETVEKDLFGLE